MNPLAVYTKSRHLAIFGVSLDNIMILTFLNISGSVFIIKADDLDFILHASSSEDLELCD
jgi:hypothetical protein